MIYRICLLSLITVTLGCGKTETARVPAPTTENEDVAITEADVKIPATYAEALPQIKGYRDTIRDAIAAGTPGKAHRALDELDIVLKKLPSIAKDSGVPAEHWETVNTSAQELRSSFNKVHASIDARLKPDYQPVAEPIDEAIAKLEQVPQ
jgi:hypothetical protein